MNGFINEIICFLIRHCRINARAIYLCMSQCCRDEMLHYASNFYNVSIKAIDEDGEHDYVSYLIIDKKTGKAVND